MGKYWNIEVVDIRWYNSDKPTNKGIRLNREEAKTLLDISNKGLEKRDILNKNNKNETLYLNHLNQIVENKMTNAHHMINKFSDENLETLYDK